MASELFRLPTATLSRQLTEALLPEACSGTLPDAILEAMAFIETARESPILLMLPNAPPAIPNPGGRARVEIELVGPDGVKPLASVPLEAPGRAWKAEEGAGTGVAGI